MSEHEEEWFKRYCENMEQEFGRGWKRRLAQKVGVGESNVQAWIKSGRVPPAVRKAITLSDELVALKNNYEELCSSNPKRWIEEVTIHDRTTFSVHEIDVETGFARLVADHINDIDVARELANLPEIKERIDEAVHCLYLENMYDDPDDLKYVKQLQNIDWNAKTTLEKRAKSSLEKVI
nr:hypothetical protein [uncultured Cohaesibacter sp.]